jgi:hypothetical protein
VNGLPSPLQNARLLPFGQNNNGVRETAGGKWLKSFLAAIDD